MRVEIPSGETKRFVEINRRQRTGFVLYLLTLRSQTRLGQRGVRFGGLGEAHGVEQDNERQVAPVKGSRCKPMQFSGAGASSQ